MYHVLLYYKLCEVPNPDREVVIQKEVCRALGLTGRILIAEYGINGTVGGTKEAIQQYRAYMDQTRPWQRIDWKESTSEVAPFPRLRVRRRDEIITTGTKDMVTGACARARHVSRDTFHEWLVKGEDMVILDMRNDYEWEIGRFVNSVRPPMKYFRELKDHIGWYKENFMGKKIVTFCTGGIRCEPATAFLLQHGFDPKNLYQLEGGIVKYAEKYGNDGFYEGKCFVFDDRIAVPVNTSDTAVIVGKCKHCGTKNDTYRNCANRFCNALFLACDMCNATFTNACSEACHVRVTSDTTSMRPASPTMTAMVEG